MNVYSQTLHLQTQGNDSMHDLTPKVSEIVMSSPLLDGITCIFVVGSTASITTIEFEPGLQHDFPAALSKIAPSDGDYKHEATSNDDNGHSHVKASILGPSITVPFNSAKLELGTWQQIVLIDFDTRARERTVIVQLIGS